MSESACLDVDLVELLRRQAAERPDRGYTWLAQGEEPAGRLTYAGLDLRACAIAAALAVAVPPGERALLLLPPGLELVAAFFGCLYAGVIAVPSYPPHSRRPDPRLKSIAEDCRPRAVLTTAALLARREALAAQVPELAPALWLDTELLRAEDRDAGRAPAPEEIAFLQYTSGSTGTPKGVIVTHANLLHNLESIRRAFGQTPESVVVGWLPLFHDMGLIGNVLQPCYTGSDSVLMPPAAFLQKPARWLQAIHRFRGTTSGGPNFAYDLCARSIGPEVREGLDLSSWRVAFNGAEPVRADTLRRFSEVFASCGFRREAFFPCYGLAEATLLVAAGRAFEASDGAPVSCGAPEGGEVLVVAPETGREAAPGEVGEIWVAGPSVAAGYWNRPAETRETFGALLREGSGPFLRTGDLGFVRHGELVVAGRLKDLIILRGRNLHPQDLERTAEQSHPAVRPGCGAAFSVEEGGEERVVLVSEIERRHHLQGDLGAIADAIRRAVAEEHGVGGADVVLLRAGTIPKTSSGKIRRRECRSRYLAGELGELYRSATRRDTAGRLLTRFDLLALDPPERASALTIWLREEIARRAGVAAERLDLETALAAAGLDSLALFDLQARLEGDLGLVLPGAPLSELSVAALRDRLLDGLAGTPEPGSNGLPPLVPGEVLGPHPLSPGQEALWFLDQSTSAEGTEGVFHIAAAVRLDAGVDGAALLRAALALVARHPALRTTFEAADGEPRQRVHASLPPDLREVDAAGWSAEELDRALRSEARRRLDLAQGPPLRLRLFARPGGERVLLLVLHHLAGDFWSLAVLLRDWAALYARERNVRDAALPDLPAAYTDFVRWQRSLLAGPAGERLERHWLDRLRGAPLTLDLPADRPRPPVAAHAGALLGLRLDPDATGRVRELSRLHGATLFTTLLAAFQVLLGRLTGQDDFLAGSPTTGRRDRDLDGVVGYFVNPVALRADLSGDPPFSALLARTRQAVAEALEHRDLPFAQLTRRLQPVRDPARPPVVQVQLVLQQAAASSQGGQEQGLAAFAVGQAGERIELEGLAFESLRLDPGTAQLDLTLSAAEVGGALVLSCEHDTALFDGVTIGRWLRCLGRLLEGAAAGPQARLRDLPWMSEAERQQTVLEWNDRAAASETVFCLPDLIEAQARRTPEAIALVCAGACLSYGELDRRSNRLARHLRALGVGPEVRVGLCLESSLEWMAGLVAVLKAGGVHVPLDPDYPRERLEWMLRDSGVAVVLDEGWDEIARSGADPPGRCLEPDNLAYVIYTSGSTGIPKGVPITHANVVPLLLWSREVFGFGEHTRVLQTLSSAFDFGVFEVLTPLLSGGTLFLRRGAERGDVDLSLLEIRRHGINTLHATPSYFRALAAAALAAGERLDTLAVLHLGGEALSPGLVEAAFTVAGEGCRLFNGYGPTEAAINCALFEVERETRPPVPIGRPSAAGRLHVVDRWMQPVPAGVPGELLAGGVGLSRGYLGRPGQTAARFLPDPFGDPGGRLYRTGDLVRFRGDGALEFLGRIDDQVKIRGFRIELGEIEAALSALPGVREAAVVAREDRLVAYVAGDAEAGALRRSLRERLPAYMVPSAFVPLAALPRTPSGKVDRKALLSPGAAPERQRSGESGLAPRTPAEEVLAGIWAELLGLERVGPADHFFDLGGHSLLATRVISRLRKAFGVELPLGEIFEAPVLADLAVRVETARRSGPGRMAPPLLPVPREGPLPLSFAQQRLWFIDQLEPGSPLYNIPAALRVEGPLDSRVLALCLGEIVRRHEALRTVFPARDGAPVQVVRPAEPFVLPLVDLSDLSDRSDLRHARALAQEEAARPFDLARGPLLRGALLRLAEEDHVVALTLHHIVSDGWSLGVLVREVTALYAAFAEGRPSPLPELPVQYADFAAWQASWLHGEILESEISHWRRQLAGLPPLLDLPADRPRPAVQSYRGASRPVRLPAALSRQAQALSRREGATLFMVLLAGFQALLGRSSGQDHLAVGIPVAGRNRAETEGLIGFFVNTLVLRADLTGQPTFRELLGRVRETALAAHEHQDLPFEKLVQELAPERSLAHAPLFQVMFALQNAPAGSLEIRDLLWRPVGGAATTAKFDLTLHLEERDGGLEGTVEHSTDLFDGTTIDRLILQYQRLLAAALAAPELPVAELPVLNKAERWQILAEWNDTAPVPAPGACLHELFEAQARRTPEAVALIAGPREILYRELARNAGRLAAPLRRCGAGPEVVVGVCLERSADLVAALLAVLEAGAAYLPLDPQLPRLRLAALLTGARASLVVSDQRLAAGLAWDGPLVLVDQVDQMDGGSPTPGRASADPDNLAYVLFTSGSTGAPKGVAVTHRSAVELVRWAGTVFAPEELAGVLASTSLAFDLSVFELFVPLSWGGTVILARNALELPSLISSGPAAGRVTLVNTVPSAMAELVRAGSLGASVRTVCLAGEPLQRSLADRVYATGTVERVWNLYGPSEDTTYSTFARVDRDSSAAPAIGRPVTATQAYVLADELEPVPVGVAGELHLGGAGLARGYLHRPEWTAERFLPDPFAAGPGARLYRTGDRARWTAAGELELLGRVDHQVKIRGFRIELGEIEAALVSLDGVREAAVVAREEPRQLVAYVAGDAEAEALRRSLRERLPDYMVPAAFVILAALPLTPNGKVDRKALLSPGAAPERPRAESHLAPRTPVEEVLAGIWADLLGLERVGAADHFFDLGGHSLLATRVVAAVRDAFRVDLPLRLVFERPTLAGLAGAISEAGEAAAPVDDLVVPIPREPGENRFPVSFSQLREWILDRLEPGNPAYNIPFLLRIEGPLDVPVLMEALQGLVRRHEVFRTRFVAGEEEPLQTVLPEARLETPVIDLSALPESRRDGELTRQARGEAATGFDLAAAPLLRARIVRLAPQSHALLLTVHHIIADGWSMGILNRELAALYEAGSRMSSPSLPPLPVQYADYAVWQRRRLGGAALERQAGFWRQRLAGAPPLLELPTDRPRPPVRSSRGGKLPFSLPQPLAARLRELARRRGATLFMVLLAGYQTLLARWSGQDDVVAGTYSGNRPRRELEGLIGFFINTLVLRTGLAGDPSFAALLGRVRQTTLEAYAHADVPFEKLLETLQLPRDPSRTPLFQALLVLHNFPRALTDLSTGVRLSSQPVECEKADYDLELWLGEEPEGIAGALRYSAGLFDEATVTRFAGQLRTLLEGAVAGPERNLWTLPLILEEEQVLQLQAWSRGPAVPAGPPLLHHLVEEQAARTPDAVALEADSLRLTYAELADRASQLARHLRGKGAGPGMILALTAERTPKLIVSMLAALQAGAAYLPLDPAYPQERRDFMLADSGAVLIKDIKDQEPQSLVSLPSSMSFDAAPAYVIYTSGSTGRPKGVAVPHGAIASFVRAARQTYALAPGDRVLQLASLSFDTSAEEIWPALASGATLVLRPEDMAASIPHFLRELGRLGITVLDLPTAFWHELVTGMEAEDLALPPGLRLVILGGEEALADRFALWQRRVGASVRLINTYGPTEATIVATRRELADLAPGSPIPIGRPIPGARAYLLDRFLAPVPPGVRGELWIGGAGVARGYLGRPDLTADRFRPDPFIDPSDRSDPSDPSDRFGARLYRTGDLAILRPDGDLVFAGRADHQLKIRGYRIEPGEVEAALRLHPALRAAVVDARGPAGEQRLVAWIVPCEGVAAPGASELRELLRGRLPDPLVPAAFVPLPELPLTPSGKVDRRALPEPAETRPGDVPWAEPQSALERAIAEIYRDLLRVSHVGLHDNFFDLGGHSLLIVRAHQRMKEALGREIPVLDLFRFPTVAALARHLGGEETGALRKVQGLADQQRAAQQRQKAAMERRRQSAGPVRK